MAVFGMVVVARSVQIAVSVWDVTAAANVRILIIATWAITIVRIANLARSGSILM